MDVGNQPFVSPETPRRCPCGKEDCRPGQRNGPECHRKANEMLRIRKAEEAKKLKAELQKARLKIIALERRQSA